MDVTFDKTGNVTAVLTISINEQDYKDEFKKGLREMGQRRPLKGFRPGKVPTQLLEKFYGPSVRADVVDHKVTRALTDYIVNNKVDLLGEPMMSVESKIDFEKGRDFEFKFDLGLAPEFECKLDKRVKIPYYDIEVSDEMVENQNKTYRKRFGKQVPGEEAAEDSLVRGSMTELNEDGSEKEGGLKVERTLLLPRHIKDEGERAKLIGAKTGAEVVINPAKAADGSEAEIASMLNIDKAQAKDIKSDFKFTISEILVNEDAEMGEDFYDEVLGKGVAKTEEEYRAKLKEMIGNQLKTDSNYRFTVDAERVLRKKVGKLELPDEFLKRFLATRSKDKTAEQVAEDYDKTSDALQWQLIREKIARNLEVKVEAEDKVKYARYMAAQQFAQYGMSNLPDDVLDRYAHELLENPEYSEQISNQAMDDKVYAAIKDSVTIEEKTVSVEEFNKLFEK